MTNNHKTKRLAFVAKCILSAMVIFAAAFSPVVLAILFSPWWLALSPAVLVLAGLTTARLLED